MALAQGTTGSLRPTFVSAWPVGLAVRQAYAFALLGLISDQPEPTFARLRYTLGGDRPSQTTHHAGSQPRIHGAWLDIKIFRGGISRMAPRRLAPTFQSLPPILHINILIPMQSYSKGARGLSV